MARRLRIAAALAALALLTAACQMTIDVTTLVRADGSGSFRIVFAFDEEFVDVVRSTDQGRASLEQLSEAGDQFAGSGWTVSQAQPDGGLNIDISRRFDDTAELQTALRDVAARTGDRALGFLSVFRDFSIAHSSTFFRAGADVSGTVDLTPERLVPGADTGDELRAALQQAARDVFRFTVRLDLPGRIGAYRGDPDSVAGGTIVWTVPFGDTLAFSASSSGFKGSALAIVIGPAGALLGGAALWWGMRRRRDRRVSVPGWDVAAVADGDDEISVATPGGEEPPGEIDTTNGGSP